MAGSPLKVQIILEATEQDHQIGYVAFAMARRIRQAISAREPASELLAVHEIYRITVDRLYLAIARMFDKDNDSGGIVKMANHLDQRLNRDEIVSAREARISETSAYTAVESARASFRRLADSPPFKLEDLQYIRDKVLAHTDLKHKVSPQAVAALKEAEIEKFQKDLSRSLNYLHHVLRDTEVAYHFLDEQMTEETSWMLAELSLATEYHTVVKDNLGKLKLDPRQKIHEQTKPSSLLPRLWSG